MNLVKVILILSAVLAVVAAAVWQFWLKEQAHFARVATAYTAKQVCSCRFVAQRPLASCLTDFTDDISQLTITEDGERIISKAPLGLATNQARFEPGLGCTLERPQ